LSAARIHLAAAALALLLSACSPEPPSPADTDVRDTDPPAPADPCDPGPCYDDDDGDGWGTDEVRPPGDTSASTRSGDCNDFLGSIHPGAEELCDEQDQDCDGEIDEGLPRWADADGDGFGAGDPAPCDGSMPEPAASVAGDCDDFDASANPAVASDPCDGADQDCDGYVDEDGCEPPAVASLRDGARRWAWPDTTRLGAYVSEIGDFDGAGGPDVLVVGAAGSATTRVLDVGSDEPLVVLDAGNDVFYGVAVGDTDGDGDGDVAFGEYGSRAWVLDGRTVGVASADAARFTWVTTTPADDSGWVGVGPAGDVDGDGLPDVILTTERGFLVGSAAGTGQERFTSADLTDAWYSPDGCADPTSADVDGDGLREMIASTGKETLLWPFGDEAALATFEPGMAVAAADIDGDGRDEVLLSNATDDRTRPSAVYAFSGTSSGDVPLRAAVARVSGEVPDDRLGQAFAVDDLDGDGVADLVATGADRVFAVLGPLEGTRSVRSAHAAWEAVGTPSVAIVGDAGADGLPEMVVGEPGRTYSAPGEAFLWLSPGL
jgi:hypothetical protein